MNATASRAVSAGDVVRNRIEGQDAAEQFLQSLRRFSMAGGELEQVVSNSAFMEADAAASWRRGFYARIQKACQRAMDITP